MSDEEKKTPDWPNIDEQHWYALAVAGAILLLVAAPFAYGWVFQAEDELGWTRRVQVLTPLGTLLAGLVTFATVAWRGMVTSRQANEQKRQNDANETVNYVSILERGAKLLGNNDSLQDRLAGIALIEICVNEPQRRLAQEAFDLLSHYVQENASDPVHKQSRQRALQSMQSGHLRYNLTASTPGIFVASAIARDELHQMDATHQRRLVRGLHNWEPIFGFEKLTLKGGAISHSTLHRMLRRSSKSHLDQRTSVTLKNVTLHNVSVPSGVSIMGCVLINCKMSKADPLGENEMEGNTFIRCDFSGVVFEGDEILKALLRRPNDADRHYLLHNYFEVDNPPMLVQEHFDPDDFAVEVETIDVRWDIYLTPVPNKI